MTFCLLTGIVNISRLRSEIKYLNCSVYGYLCVEVGYLSKPPNTSVGLIARVKIFFSLIQHLRSVKDVAKFNIDCTSFCFDMNVM